MLSLSQRDKACLWHPFTQMLNAKDPIAIVKAKGSYLYAEDGTAYLDAISSWWVNLHGHAHPYIADKISAQTKILEHVLFAGFTHPNAVDFAERLLKILPGGMSRIFYSDNGSTAVEAALKMALQYWHNKNSETSKVKVISFTGGYHGDTFGAMSAAGKNEFNKPFWSHLFSHVAIDPPYLGCEGESIKQLKAVLETDGLSSACFIFEPLILGAGGMRIYSKEALNALLLLCREHNVLTIADEVMTGFGRTNSVPEQFFACDGLTQTPDIMCLSKGITGGFLPMGATACTEAVFAAFLSENPMMALLHGHSYTANPLACAAAIASLDLLESPECAQKRLCIVESQRNFCSKWQSHPKLKRCESLGTILVLEYKTDGNHSYFHSLGTHLSSYFLAQNIVLRPLGNVLYVLPPYCITESELEHIYTHIIYTLENF